VGVIASVQHACAWIPTGELACWGHGEGGRLGYGGSADQPRPIAVPLSGVVRVASEYRHTCAIKDAGDVYCWGYDTSGECGDPGGGNLYSPVAVHGPGNVGTFTSATDLGAGDTHTCARRTDGTVWCWGTDGNGRLGDGPSTGTSGVPVQAALPVPARSIAIGNRTSCALSADGLEVWCWGYNVDGELGTGGVSDSDVPIRALVGCAIVPEVAAEPAPAPEPMAEGTPRTNLMPLGLMAAGGVALVAGGILIAIDQDPDPVGMQQPTYRDTATAGVVIGVAGAAAVAAGAYLWMQDRKHGAPVAAVTHDSAVVGWTGRF
jgi:hypothetical protein